MVLRATLAAGAAAVAGLFLPATLAALVMALAVTCATVPPSDWLSLAKAMMWALVAAGGVHSGGAFGLGVSAVAVGASLTRGVVGPARWAALACGTVGALTAGLVTNALATTDALRAWPDGLRTLAGGAVGGLVVGVSAIGRQLARAREPEQPALGHELELAGLADPSELGQLLGRAALAHRDALAVMGDEAPAARAAADDMVLKMTRFGRRWRDLELEAARSRPDELNARLLLVGRKLEASADPLARLELGRAKEALAAQLGYLDEIHHGRERAMARLEHQVAALERLRLAALRQRSADAGRLGAELQPVVDELAQAGGDFDVAAEALTEATEATAEDVPETRASNLKLAGALPPRS
jgi:hypothetical protein